MDGSIYHFNYVSKYPKFQKLLFVLKRSRKKPTIGKKRIFPNIVGMHFIVTYLYLFSKK